MVSLARVSVESLPPSSKPTIHLIPGVPPSPRLFGPTVPGVSIEYIHPTSEPLINLAPEVPPLGLFRPWDKDSGQNFRPTGGLEVNIMVLRLKILF